MTSENNVDAPGVQLDEHAIALKYGVRPLHYPDVEHVKTLTAFLRDSFQSGRCAAVPDASVTAGLEFIQGIVTRQHITKGPRITPAEFDVLQRPYNVASRIISRMQRERRESARGQIYQTTYLSLTAFVDLLQSLLDPKPSWIQNGAIPAPARVMMSALHDFLIEYPEQRRKSAPQ